MNIKNLKRRLSALVLTGVMACSLAVPAFAAENPTTTITGTYSTEATAEKVVSISYAMQDTMNFTYSTGANKGTWDPKTHSYSGGSAGGAGTWTATGDTSIKVTNHSNTAVNCRFAWSANSGFESIKVGTTKNDFTLATAEGTTVENAPSQTVTVGVTEGALTSGQTNVEMGTLTLRITAA